jgi:small subunit ribosomal protein S9
MVKTAFAPLQVLGATYAVSARVRGGGHKAQAESIRLGISRAMIEIIPEQRKDLKVRGFLKRDPRAKERKKFGLKAARRAPQWSKR